jgi:hypothetical protein
MGSTALAVPGQAAPIATVGETSSSAIAAREKAAVEARFLVAMHRPRNPDMARTRLLARCASPRFAEVAEYAKPVGGGKKAYGASIRMMEEFARQWGNIDIQATVVFDDRERRTITVTATDLESNYSGSVDVMLEKTVERRSPRDGDEVLGSRTNSTGTTVYRILADEDAFLVKQNANISKARRECIRAIVPGDLVDEAMQRCADTRRSEVRTDPAAARKRIADAFFGLGVMPDQLCEFLGKPSLEAVTEAEIELLRAIYAGMKDGESSWAEVMEQKHGPAKTGEPSAATGKGAGGLKAALGKKSTTPASPAVPAVDPNSPEAIAAQDAATIAADVKKA